MEMMEEDVIKWTSRTPSVVSDNVSRSLVDHEEEEEDARTSVGLNNVFYYLFLVPIGLICNALTFTVVVVIMRNRRSRQSIPDACICLLTALDFLSILFIHLPMILAASASGRWSIQTTGLCVYQAFATSFYLKFQFLVQVTMGLDRFFAITTPLNYHRLRSFTTFKLIIVVTVTASASSTALTFVFDTVSLRKISTWRFCYFEWHLQTIADYVINIGITLFFTAGFLAFLFSNAALVRFFWRYNFQKAETLVRDISNAMKAAESMEAQKALVTCAERCQTGMMDLVSSQRAPECRNGVEGAIDCSTAEDRRLPPNDEGIADQQRSTDERNMTTEWSALPMDSPGTRGNLFPAGDVARKGKGEERAEEERAEEERAEEERAKEEGFNGRSVNDGSAIGIDEDPLDAAHVCHGYNKQKLNNKGATEKSDQYEATIEQTPIANISIGAAIDTGHQCHQNHHHQQQLHQEQNEQNYSSCVSFHSRKSSSACPCTVARLDQGTPGRDHKQLRAKSGLSLTSETFDQCKPMSSAADSERSNADATELHLKRRCWSPSVIDLNSDSPSSAECNHDNSSTPISLKEIAPNKRPLLPDRSSTAPAIESAAESAAEAESLTSDSDKMVNQRMIYFLERIRSLVERTKRNIRRQNRQLLLLKCVVLCSFVFVVTWLPYTVLQLLVMAKHEIGDVLIESSMKLVFANALFNALLHGFFRKNYRKGFHYITRAVANVVSCGLVSKPSEDLVFFDSKKTTRTMHQKAADMNRSMKTLQAIQRTLRHASRVSASWTGTSPSATPGHGAGDASVAEFLPSKRLQELFDQCLQDSAQFDDSDTSSDIDYDAMVFAEQVKIYDELKTVWSQVRL